MKKRYLNAFSLMEMMVVLLIVAIIAAATAPMVTKKMMRNAGSGDSPWVFTGLGNSIAYNMNGSDNATAIIGNVSTPSGWNRRARLFIDSGNNAAHIAFGNGNATPLLLTADPQFGRIGFSNDEIPSYSVAFGTGQTLEGEYTVAIGNRVQLNNAPQGAVAIGDEVVSNGSQYTVAIGVRAEAAGNNSIAIGGMTGSEYTSAASNGIALGTGTKASGDSSIALGLQAKANNLRSIAIGSNAEARAERSIALGGYNIGNDFTTKTIAFDKGGIAIGSPSLANGNSSVVIGPFSSTSKQHSIAVGSSANVAGNNSIAIGSSTVVGGNNSIAIGNNITSLTDNQIVLGTKDDTVYIPGHLVAQDIVATRGLYFVDTISGNNRGLQLLDQWRNPDGRYCAGVQRAVTVPSWLRGYTLSGVSDRRLKNVGEKYTAGLDELKKLDFYHYTFKKDEAKTPMVGVMAQDLQKVFPDAVTKGEDGYLRIRIEDMFYSVINAVKELDSKISGIIENINGINSKIEKLEKENAELQKVNSDLLKTNSELQEEIKNIEKRIEKLES